MSVKVKDEVGSRNYFNTVSFCSMLHASRLVYLTNTNCSDRYLASFPEILAA